MANTIACNDDNCSVFFYDTGGGGGVSSTELLDLRNYGPGALPTGNQKKFPFDKKKTARRRA